MGVHEWAFIVFVVFAVWLAIAATKGSIPESLPKLYRSRSCMGRYWRRRFPSVPKQEIRRFLDIFIDAFAFSPEHKLNFGPDDKLRDIMKAIYTNPFTPDIMEIETLHVDLEERFEIAFPADFGDENLTLGEVFAFIVDNSPRLAPRN